MNGVAESTFQLKSVPNEVGNQLMDFDQSEWQLVSDEPTYTFWVNKTAHVSKDKDELFEVYTMTWYKEYGIFPAIQRPVKKIYTRGVIGCSDQKISLLANVYAMDTEEIVFIQQMQFEEYVIEVATPGTARNKLYLRVCNDSI
jgi:hypothetical protein